MFNMNRVAEKFTHDFYDLKDIPMAIYGMGNNAKSILMNSHDFNISCVIVNDNPHGFFCEKKVLSIEEAIHSGIEIIILAAETDVEIIIYERIKKICEENRVRVFGLYLGEMKKIFDESHLLVMNDNKTISLEEIFHMIDCHDIISFDIFDTLITRLTLSPLDVFSIVQRRIKNNGIIIEDFPFYRVHAEITNPIVCPTIHDIYDYLQTTVNINKSILDAVKKVEIDVEKDLIIPKNDILEIYKYAKSKNKRIYLISDMYLPKPILEVLLSNVGINEYEELIVSCDVKTTKNEDLYKFYNENFVGDRRLHIGDSYKLDGLNAIMQGIDAIVIPGVYEMLPKSVYKKALDVVCSINDRSLLSMFAHRLYDNPFRRNIKIDSAREFGFLFIGPVITSFMVWLMKKIKNDNYSKVLFAARDGYLFLKLYNAAIKILRLEEMPEGLYFYTSRKACLRSYCTNKENLDEILSQYSFTMDDIYRNFTDGGKIKELSDSELLEISNNEYSGYEKYLSDLQITEYGRYAFVDLVSGGTCQYYLEKLFKINLKGLYLGRGLSWVKIPPVIESYISEWPGDMGAYFTKINQVKLLESVMTSNEPSLAGFNKDGTKKFLPYTMTEEYLHFVSEVQTGITCFFETFLEKLFINDESISISVPRLIMEFRNSTDIASQILDNIHIEDELMGTSF